MRVRRFRPRVLEIGDVELFSALGQLREHERPVLLDSAAGDPRTWSVLGFDPLDIALESAAGVLAPRLALRNLVFEAGDALPGPFHGGFLGAFAYDLGVLGERGVQCAPEPFGFAPLIGGVYCDFLVRDERSRRTWLVLGDTPGDARQALDRRRERIMHELGRARPATALKAGVLGRCVSADEHRARVERCRASISRGELYQANLAHRFTCEVEGAPVDWYARLREVNPAPYMGFAAFEQGALLSASPELLFEFESASGRARTRPIKGTAARQVDALEDERAKRALLASQKDRAELAMIVDLERNDLGRIARAGGVWVEDFPHVASLARVHHTMADVVADIRPGLDACDVLAALFPGGSVTGAPKLSAMDVIADLEGEGRGFFCGSLGFVDTRGQAAFNILIRTLLWRPRHGASGRGEVSFRVGGGITWSSLARAEERETLDKAAGLIAALQPEGECRLGRLGPIA